MKMVVRKLISSAPFLARGLFAVTLTAGILTAPFAVYASPEACLEAFSQTKSVEELAREQAAARVKSARMMVIPMDEPGRVMWVETIPPARPDLPMFLMMPGMNRAGQISDPSSLALVAAGYGVAEMNFSVHPFSVGAIPKGTDPYFAKREPTLQDFAAEANKVAQVLTEEYKLKNLIPVSLSFSGSVSPFLKGYPLIIDTVPMTSTRAASPEGAQYLDSLRASQSFNIFFGASIVRTMMDTAYQSKWASMVKTMIEQFKLPAARESDMTKGYVALSRAAEDSTWDNDKIPKETRRVMILALGEGHDLLLSQVQTAKRLIGEGYNLKVVAVGSAGHMIFNDQPDLYQKAIALASSNDPKSLSTMNILLPAEKEKPATITRLDGQAAIEKLDLMIEHLTNPKPVEQK